MMKSRFALLAFSLLLGLGSHAVLAAPPSAQPALPLEKVPVTLTATLTKQEFGADEAVDLSVTLQNNDDKSLFVGDTGVRFALFNIVVTRWIDNRMENVARTSFGEYQLTASSGAFGNITFILPPKGKQHVVFPLRRMFDLSLGGTFSVDVSRSFDVERSRTATPTGEDPPVNPDSYRKEIEVKVAPRLPFSVASPPNIEQELTNLPGNNF